MPPILALFLCTIFILLIIKYDHKRSKGVSGAIWIPVLWMMILGSKNISHWLTLLLNRQTNIETAQAYYSGNPIDRFILLLFIIAGIVTLLRRRFVVRYILKHNAWIILFFGFATFSLFWSDFPNIVLRRWVKGLGSIIMIMVILTEEDLSEAVISVIRRCVFVLIPLSILLIKYFPRLGMAYGPWTGLKEYLGVATSKNMLGRLCFISVLVFLMSILNFRKTSEIADRKWEFAIYLSYFGMTGWLLLKSNTVTAIICISIGSFILVVSSTLSMATKNFRVIGILVVSFITVFLLGYFVFDLAGPVSKILGRDPTLTGRTELWKKLLSMGTNPIIGVGYDSFWLGKRLDAMWALYWWQPNQAHNGYIEVYLNFGLVGIFLLGGAIINAYGKIRRNFSIALDFGRLEIAYLVPLLLYNFTDVGFKFYDLLGFIFFLIIMTPLIKPVIPMEDYKRHS